MGSKNSWVLGFQHLPLPQIKLFGFAGKQLFDHHPAILHFSITCCSSWEFKIVWLAGRQSGLVSLPTKILKARTPETAPRHVGISQKGEQSLIILEVLMVVSIRKGRYGDNNNNGEHVRRIMAIMLPTILFMQHNLMKAVNCEAMRYLSGSLRCLANSFLACSFLRLASAPCAVTSNKESQSCFCLQPRHASMLEICYYQ